MKQFYLALAALAAAPVWAATPPYYSDMGSAPAAAIDPEWTIINENSASNTWVYDNTNDNLTKVTGAPAASNTTTTARTMPTTGPYRLPSASSREWNIKSAFG